MPDLVGVELLLRGAWPGESEHVVELRAVVLACILEQFGELLPVEILTTSLPRNAPRS